jgi:hypothetical protein
LTVTIEPPGSVPWTQGFNFVVAAEDPYGNLATSFNQSVTASLTNTVGNGFAGGGVTAFAVAGVASFSNFFVGSPGTGYTIRITSSDGRFSAVTTPFNVTSGAPAAGAAEIIRERVLTSGRGKKKHLTGFQLDFSSALDSSRASIAANYAVMQTVGRGRQRVTQPVRFTVQYESGSHAVNLLLASRDPFTRGGWIAVNVAPPSGITDASGVPLTGKTVFFILPKARSVRG